MNEEKRQWYIPAKIVLEKELFDGLSVKAGAISGVVMLVFFMLGLVISDLMQLGSIGTLWITGIPTAISLAIQWRISGGTNFIEAVQLLIRFNASQKRYLFQYLDKGDK